MTSPRSVDVARLAGVSQPTVSRVLNGHPSVAPSTRERVLEAIRDLGYEPSQIARGLATNRTGVVGVVFSDLLNPFHPPFLDALSAELAANDLRLLLQSEPAAMEERDSVGPLLRHRVDGLVFTAVRCDSTLVPELLSRRFPLVLANRYVEGVSCDTVTGDNQLGARSATEHLIELGHRRLAMIAGDPSATTSRDRVRGFLSALRKHSLRPVAMRNANFSYDLAHRETLDLLAQEHRPSGVVCADDLMAFAALNAAAELNIKVPEQLSVVGFDDVAMASWQTFNLTTVRQPMAEMARTAAQLLHARLGKPRRKPSQVVLDSTLVVRGTSGPPPAAR